MAQHQSLYPAQRDTFENHGSRDGIGLDIDWQKSDELPSEELDLITDAILELQKELGINPAGAYTTVLAWLTALQAAVTVQKYKEINLPAGSWNYPTANPAPLDRDVGGSKGMFRNLFDDTTEEFIILEPAFELPDNLDAGTVYFSLYGYSETAVGAKFVEFRLAHCARALGEDWDAAYVNEDSGDYATDADQDDLDKIEWSETVAALGWTAEDLVSLKLSRIAPVGANLAGDYGFVNLKIRIPVT